MRRGFKNLLKHLGAKRIENERGQILVGVMITMVFLIIVALATAEFSLTNYNSAKRTLVALDAINTAEAGAEEGLFQLNQNSSYTPPSGEQTLYNDNIKGKATYELSLANGSFTHEKVLISTGRVYQPFTTTPKVTRKVKITIRGTVPFQYGVQTGSGPIYMYGDTAFTADVETNSYIEIQDNSVSFSGGAISVAGTDPNYNSPPNNTCSVDHQGKITGGTINVAGQLTPSPPNCGVDTTGATVLENKPLTPQLLPTVDKAGILSGISSNVSPCSSVQNVPYELDHANYPDQSSQTYDSTCSVSLAPTQTYSLKGDVYIRGDLTIDRNTIQVDNSLTQAPYVIVEGKITVKGNGTAVTANSSNIGAIFVSYNNADSNGDKTLPNAISIDGNSLSLYANFFAPNGSIGYTGRGVVGKLAANSMVLNSSGTTTFIDITSALVTPSIWNVQHYQQIF